MAPPPSGPRWLRLAVAATFACSVPSWVQPVPPPRTTRRAAASNVPVLEDPPSLLPELLELGASGEGGALDARIEEVFADVSPDDLSMLRMKVSDPEAPDHAAAQRVGAGIQAAMERRLASAKGVLEDLINNADGDVNVLIKRMLKKVDSPLPVLMVLQLNIQEAQQQGDGEKVRALMHISTVMQEEMEKKASRVRGMLNKLLRIEDESIRNNILRDQLTPVEVAGAPDLDGSGAKVMAAMVPWERLAPAIEGLVKEVDRQMLAVLGPDDAARYETMDRIREVAKQARVIIGEVYGQGPMDTFSADLTPAFHTLMTYKVRERGQGNSDAEAPTESPPEGDEAQAEA